MPLEHSQTAAQGFWHCPLNVGGLIKDDLFAFLENDLYDILQPTVMAAKVPECTFQRDRSAGLIDYGNLHRIVEQRVAGLTRFLRQVGLGLSNHPSLCAKDGPFGLHALSGDSHNGGKRPIVVDDGERRWVLKFTDPRPHLLLADILRDISDALGIDLTPPEIYADSKHQWYFAPYLDHEETSNTNVEGFMFAIGALTAVAYCLRMVDLHLENILVFQGKPIIVDPECILYNFSANDQQGRLLSTGLLSHNPGLSALRGGDVSKVEISQIGLSERFDGMLDYQKPAPRFHNRLRLAHGEMVDPVHYKAHVLSGFKAAYRWFMGNPDLVSDILAHHIHDDFRIRYLVRKTRLYVTTIHMLNLPVGNDYDAWKDSVFDRFRTAGHFPKRVSKKLVEAELMDMEARDVPYFWVNAGERIIRHHTGPKQMLTCPLIPFEQALVDIHSLSEADLKEQSCVLGKFLDVNSGAL